MPAKRALALMVAFAALSAAACAAPAAEPPAPEPTALTEQTPPSVADMPQAADSPHPRVPRTVSAAIQTPAAAPLPAAITYPAGDAGVSGSLTVDADGAVGRFEQKDDADKLTFTIEIEQEGFYSLNFDMSGYGGHKENYLWLDGERTGVVVSESADFAVAPVRHVYLMAGAHSVAITAFWGWIAVRSLTVAPEEPSDGSIYNIPMKLVNPNANDDALALMSFLVDNYGKTALAGQQSQGDWKFDNGLFGGEAAKVLAITGKSPAVIGLDMINYTPSRMANGARSHEVSAAIDAWNAGAIVTFCWHWNAPAPYMTGEWGGGFYTDHCKPGFFKKIMDGDDAAGYELLIEDIDAIAEQLKTLQEAGVPVLWRPLHEASGGWFWWGTDRESYLKLYKLMYTRLTFYHGLNNLIWVWNGQHKDWYPGDAYADIIGEDIYPGERVHGSQVSKFLAANDYTAAPKMVTLSENGCLFDPDLAARDGAMWSWWCVWNGEFVNTEKYTDYEAMKRFYNSEYVTTLDKLPDLKTYPIYVDGDAE